MNIHPIPIPRISRILDLGAVLKLQEPVKMPEAESTNSSVNSSLNNYIR